MNGFTLNKGEATCDEKENGEIGIRPQAADYNWANGDWPLNEYQCIQGKWTGAGTSNMSGSVWFNGKLIIDFTGLDGTGYAVGGNQFNPGYQYVTKNAYYNHNAQFLFHRQFCSVFIISGWSRAMDFVVLPGD